MTARSHATKSAAQAKGSMAPSIVVRMLAAHNVLVAELRRGLGPELTLARFDLLAQLVREDGATLATLSRRMLVTAGNLTGLVDRAERDGIVERRADPTDRRLTRVYLTPKGQKLAHRAVREHNDLAERLLASLGDDEQRRLRDLLGRLREVLEEGRASTERSDEDLADDTDGGSR